MADQQHTMLKYAVYVRKSDDDKSVTEKSLRDQLAELQPIIERERLSVVKFYEESKSAKTPRKRPLWNELVSLVYAGKIDAIACWHFNRLSRNMLEGGEVAQLLVDGMIKEIRTPSAIYKTGDNIMPIVVEAASAAQYSLDHTKNVNRGMRCKFRDGGCNYMAPQGYRNARDPENLEVGIIVKDPARFDLVRKAWAMMLTDAYTPQEVIRTMNEVWLYRTKKTKKRPSGPLSLNYGYDMFTNPFYAGYVREKGELIKGKHFAIAMVTLDEFNRMQEIMRKHSKKQTTKAHEHAFTGLMTCAYCGQQVTAEKKKISTGALWENYRCSNAGNKCTSKGMARSKVEQMIVKALESITIDPELCQIALENIVRQLETQTEPIQALYAQREHSLQEMESKLNNLAEMWIKGLERDEKKYREREQAIIKERDDILATSVNCREDLEKMRANAVAASNYIVFARDNFMTADDARKREIAHALGFEYIFYGKEKKLDIKIHPLLSEVLQFTNEVGSTLELTLSGSESADSGVIQSSCIFGGP